MASQENGGGPGGAFRGPIAQPGHEAGPDALPGPEALPALPPTCGVAEAGGVLEASIFKIEDLAASEDLTASFVKNFRLKGKKDLLAFAEEAKALGASLVAVAKGSKESRGQAQVLAKRGLSAKLVSLKKIGRALASDIPLSDARWAAILAWCLQSQSGRIDDWLRGQLAELAANFRKYRALHQSAASAYLVRASQSGVDVMEIAGQSMGEIGKFVLEGAEQGLIDDGARRRLKAMSEDEKRSALGAMDEAFMMAAAPGEDEALAKIRDENHRWAEATTDAHNQMHELLFERGQGASLALLDTAAGITKFQSMPLLAELGSFFSDV